ncbi:ATP-binding protein [Streptomyces sp. CBMA152]|uniref:ATP-binding protein n=1 Tax=Streptomyces sp. CBMA152 TaxID=1896312 RepID=UPI0016612C2D|nr:ATP-binding protein [Streptomyces sp. CBMA152]MBD0746816.1 two-component sensor histidine kinase [Streptomyces sp. CBMA152]
MKSERARLTALYGGLLVLAGVLLTAVVYLLVQQGLYASISTAVTTAVPAKELKGLPTTGEWASAAPASPGPLPPGVVRGMAVTRTLSDAVEHAALKRLLAVSVIVLCAYAVLSIALAWWMAGRVLRPVAVITETARRLSGQNLHERIALAGPPGELKQLADTFDGMLGRMEQLVSAQQRFAANAAHELRTPVAVQRAAAEIGLAGEPDTEKVARIRAKLIDVADDSERIIDGLLLLAASDQGLERREPVPVHELALKAAGALAREAEERGVAVTLHTGPLTVPGDAVLLDRLLHNLLANGIRHNVPHGRVELRTGRDGITVTNTGPEIPRETVHLLFEPFRRLEQRHRHAPGEGAGLGMSIVASIARAHGATATAYANDVGGGLTVRVVFGAGDEPPPSHT